MKPEACEPYQELVSALADDALNAVETAKLRDHLSECSSCRDFLGHITPVRELLRAGESRGRLPQVPRDFAASIAGKLSRERVFRPAQVAAPVTVSRRSLWGRISGAAAAAVLLLAAGWSWHGLATPEGTTNLSASLPSRHEVLEGSMDSYLREHAFQSMDATFLGPSEGLGLVSYEVSRQGLD